MALLCAVTSLAWGETITLSNADIVAAGDAKSGYQSWYIKDGNKKEWNAYAIKNQHSKTTSGYHYLQIKKSDNNTQYYIQIPEYGTKITSIKMTVSSTQKPMDGGENSATLYFSANNKTSAAGTGVASGTGASNVTINSSELNLNTGYITASAGVRIWDVEVTYESGPSKTDIAMLNSISPTSVNVNDEGTFSLAATFAAGTVSGTDYEVLWTSDNPNVLDVDQETGEYQAYAAGTANITVSVTVLDDETYNEVSKQFEVTVVDPNAPGTQTNPYTVAQALALIETLGNASSDEVYVKGFVSKFDHKNSDGSAQYWISDDGTTSSQLEIYKGKYLDGANFSSEDDLLVGDEVVICGNLKKYNTTPEFDAGSKIVSLARKDEIATDVTVTPLTVNVSEEGTFTATVTAAEGISESDYTITWTSDDDNALLVDADGSYLAGEETGEVTLTVTVNPSAEKSSQYRLFSKEFVITIVDPNANDGSLEKPYTVTEVLDFKGTKNNVWVRGYIVGSYKNNNLTTSTGSDAEIANIALYDSKQGATTKNTIPVQLTTSSNAKSLVRSTLNVNENEGMLGEEVLVYGNITSYFSKNGIKDTEDAYIITTIGGTGYSTLYYGNTALEVPEGTEAYAVTVNGDDLTYTSVGDVIPAKTGVVLKGSGEQQLHVTSEAGTAPSANNLLGFDVASQTVGADGKATGWIYYMLSLNASSDPSSVGFYFNKGSENGKEGFVSGAHKAYLAVADTGDTPVSSFVFDDFTGIHAAAAGQPAAEGIYTISGVRVNGEHLPAGLYIVNGKKMIIK